jgi:hypothetical protein
MASGLFDIACDALEQHSRLDRLEARGTLRLALKAGGIDVKKLTPGELGAVFESLLPLELTTRGVENAAEVCAAVMATVKASSAVFETGNDSEDAFDVFRRLGGD